MAKLRHEFQDLSGSDEMFLSELRGPVEEAFHQHLATSKLIVPTEIDDYLLEMTSNGTYDPTAEDIDPAVKDAWIVGAVTEDGLPYYYATQERLAPKGHPFLDWAHRWTAEEDKHSPAIYAFMHRSGQFNMRELTEINMAAMSDPDTPQPGSFIEGNVYPAIQEPATRISHLNAISRLPEGHRRMGRYAVSPVVGHETKHGIFYGAISEAALEVNASFTILAIANQIDSFAMPGKAIPNFEERKKAIQDADIFGHRQLVEIYDELFATRWQIDGISGLTPEAERARDWIHWKRGQMARTLKWHFEKVGNDAADASETVEA